MNIEKYRIKIQQQIESGERKPRPLCLPDEPVLNENGNPLSKYQQSVNLITYRNNLNKRKWS